MRISDWISDVCSSDLLVTYYWVLTGATLAGAILAILRLDPTDLRRPVLVSLAVIAVGAFLDTHSGLRTGPVNLYFSQAALPFARSAERRVRKECVSTGRSRGSMYHYKKKHYHT